MGCEESSHEADTPSVVQQLLRRLPDHGTKAQGQAPGVAAGTAGAEEAGFVAQPGSKSPAIVVHIVAALFLRNWFGVYGHAYGGFGVSLALAAFVGIIASFWVWIAAVMGVWWERKAGPAAVAKME
jgi:hypothetical protein